MIKEISASMIIVRGESDVEIYIDGSVKYNVDVNYGADADGNRGSRKVNVEEVEDVMAFNADGESVYINPKEEEQAKQILADKFLEG